MCNLAFKIILHIIGLLHNNAIFFNNTARVDTITSNEIQLISDGQIFVSVNIRRNAFMKSALILRMKTYMVRQLIGDNSIYHIQTSKVNIRHRTVSSFPQYSIASDS